MSKMKLISMLLLIFLLDCVCTNTMESLKINTTLEDKIPKEVVLENRLLLEVLTKWTNNIPWLDVLSKLVEDVIYILVKYFPWFDILSNVVKYFLSILVKYFPWLDIFVNLFSSAKTSVNSSYNNNYDYSVSDYPPQSLESN